MKSLTLAALAAIVPALAAAEVTLTDPWARASILASRPGAACLTLESDRDDRLVAVRSPAAGKVMIHRVETGNGGASRMIHLDALDLPGGETVTLAPGKTHLMLMDLAGKLEKGTTIPVILTVEVPVLGVRASGPEAAQ